MPFDDRARWAAAHVLQRGAMTDEARRIRAADQWRIAGISVAVGAAIVVLLFTTDLRVLVVGRDATDGAWWRSVLSTTGFGVAVIGFVIALPRRFGLEKVPGLPTPAPTDVLTWAQRQRLDRQISGADPQDPDLVPLAFDRAARRINEPLPLLQAAVGGLVLASLARSGPPAMVLGVWALALVAVALLIPQQLAARRAAQAFVAHHRDVP